LNAKLAEPAEPRALQHSAAGLQRRPTRRSDPAGYVNGVHLDAHVSARIRPHSAAARRPPNLWRATCLGDSVACTWPS